MNYKKKDSSFCNMPITPPQFREQEYCLGRALPPLYGNRMSDRREIYLRRQCGIEREPFTKRRVPVSSPVEQALQVTPPRTLKYANLQYTVMLRRSSLTALVTCFQLTTRSPRSPTLHFRL